MFVSHIFCIALLVSSTYCAPVKRSLTDQLAAADCIGTECSYDPDFYDNDVIVNVNIPENITDVIVNFIPDMMKIQEQQVATSHNLMQKIITVMENGDELVSSRMDRQEQQLQRMTNFMENLTQIVYTQVEKQDQHMQRISTAFEDISHLLHSQIKRLPVPPQKDCHEVFSNGFSYGSGVYTITPGQDASSLQVYCDMVTDGGPWTLFQKRFDGSVDFFLDWSQYENGFGSAEGEYWLGLKNIHALTQSGVWQLRVDMDAFDGDTAYAVYDSFNVGDAESNYRLHVSGYSGNARDSLAPHNGAAFSTRERDNDIDSSRHCADAFKGGYWYKSCHHSNLNGLYLGPSGNSATGNRWYDWKRSRALKTTEMKIRRIS